MTTPGDIAIRHALRPGDVGAVVGLHGVVYAHERGFDATFEAYVASPLAAFVLRASPRERLWLAERDGALVGCIAIVAERERVAQLRWFLVVPEARGVGLGRRLMAEAIAFSREAEYERVILWTVNALHTAAHVYRSSGFRRVEAVPTHHWGVDVVEEKYELELG
jgi:GNAT superfamily N-acetyltransferase